MNEKRRLGAMEGTDLPAIAGEIYRIRKALSEAGIMDHLRVIEAANRQGWDVYHIKGHKGGDVWRFVHISPLLNGDLEMVYNYAGAWLADDDEVTA